MSKHSETEHRLIRFLEQEKEFPSGSVLSKPTLTNSQGIPNVCPDVMVVDLDHREPLAVYEVKGESLSEPPSPNWVTQLLSYALIKKDRSIPVYLVTPSADGDGLCFHRFAKDNEFEEVAPASLPTYEQLQAVRIAADMARVKRETEQTKDNFARICFALAVIILLIVMGDFLLDFNNVQLLTANRMILIGVVVALVIIPFAQKFKGFGIEYERLRSSSPRRKKD